MKKHKTLLIIGLLLIPQMVLVRCLASYPQLVEQYYSNGLYPIVSKASRYAFGWLPFSFGDIMYAVLIVLALREIVLLIKNKFKGFKTFLLKTLAIISIVYGAFNLLWGMNYNRLPLHESLGIDNEYTTEELVQLTEKLIENSNNLHNQLAEDKNSRVVYCDKIEGENACLQEIFNGTLNGYETLKTQFPKLSYPPKSIKNSLLRYPLSIMGYSGYLNPITNEAQVNGMVPAHRWPVISSHEQAHQLGFAKENEANFIAVMATLNNEDLYFQYSGSIFALRYALNDVYSRDKELGEDLKARLNPGILVNYQDSRDFWDAMDNPLEPLFDLFYSNYLKANNQPGGLKSYSYMVALLVNYDQRFPDTF
ncbi:DUF3810 domain-containing protein [uncultured Dokdonia sp.]|uniref:DUF3810 domain-containing protein n=1 Tax=uncultured Dokdonia sp. TaxID=575653 RepID=UPI002603C50A|nr:DUF3810 domain-containing protein [uncultured Dokdonia sp.]